MASPFPGMDPYLEGYLWPDVHHTLATQIRQQVAGQVAPNYVARVSLRLVTDELGEEEIQVMIPDGEVLRPRPQGLPPQPEPAGVAVATSATIAPAPLTLSLPIQVPVRLASIEIRSTPSNELVTSIEILSPVNKRGDSWQEYREKRRKVLESRAHLMEIDLLRRGRRAVNRKELPNVPCYVFLTRSAQRKLEAWPITLRDPLPTIPVPLRPPDSDVPLDLQAALTAIYEAARYDLSVDYRRPPGIPLSDDDAKWAAELLVARPS